MRRSHAWQVMPLTRSSTCFTTLPPGAGTASRAGRGDRTLDVSADYRGSDGRRAPGAQAPPDTPPDVDQVFQLAIELNGLVAQEPVDVHTRRLAAPADPDDLLDLGQCEAQ